MKKDLLMIAIGLLIGCSVTFWINSPGKYQALNMVDPRSGNQQTALIDTQTGAIRRLYNFDGNLMFGTPELTIGQWNRIQSNLIQH